VPDQSASFSAASCASRSNNARWSCSLYRGSSLDCRSFSTRARESSNTSLRRRESNWAGVNCLFLPELSLSSNSCTWPSTALLSHPLAMRSFYVDDCLGSRNFSRSVSCANIDCPVYKCFCIWIRRHRRDCSTDERTVPGWSGSLAVTLLHCGRGGKSNFSPRTA
jgi:hypothetical protein